ncbi:hypothetical protein HC231_11255 [Brenneria izadpanahii]|uniref:CdiI immunity protein domain-containing protein n=1 Tax=Brenneria izadpanahii TaxID=2722756 RepID=A0ABX7UVP8_9GAMM|nr:contact-dependent growth inhibition system immunity protein [Brenneria izadpanahii]QTF08422.1 hypothetical protein HC231_11255 [Brenneria izadpanahii]
MFIKNKARELDNLICNYFGLDYDLIDDSEELQPKIDAYNERSGRAMQQALLDDIEELLSLGDLLDSTFHDVYGEYFDPALWGTTPREFLLLVREQVTLQLKKENN